MQATQMNTRIDGELKSRGDAVLHDLKLNSSQVVRWLWEYLDAHAGDPDALECFHSDPRLVTISKTKNARNARGQIEASRSVIDTIQGFRESHGLSGTYNEALSDKELLEQALYERLQERGLA